MAKLCRLLLSALCLPILLFVAPSVRADPVTVNFVSATPEFFGPQPLPIMLESFPNNLRLRFHVPQAAQISSLNSVNVSVNLYDDADGQTNEEGELVFVKQLLAPGSNVVLNTFSASSPGFNGSTSGSPFAFAGSVAPIDFGDALNEIQDDGFFLIRVNRRGGDFFVQSGSVTIDAQLIPEPSTYALMLAGLGLVGWAARRRAKAIGRTSEPRSQ